MPADDVNDALWEMKMGNCPSEEGLKALSGAGASVSSQEQAALNALIRIVSSEGISTQQLWKLVNAMEEKGLGSEEFTKMVQLYVIEEEGQEPVKPSKIHIPLLFELAASMLGLEPRGEKADIVDPSMRDIEKPTVEVSDDVDEEKGPCAPLKSLLDSLPWSIITGINTAWALFAGDIALAYLDKDADMAIAYVTFVVFLCFLFELIGNLVSKRDYGAADTLGEKMTMFFWMDVVGTFSLIPDFLIIFGYEFGAPKEAVLARVARAARIGARLSRLTKVFRVTDGKSKFSGAFAGKEGMDLDGEPDVASQVGAKVADGISKKVVILVIVLLMAVPLFMYQFPAPSGGMDVAKEDSMKLLQAIKNTEAGKDLGYCGTDNALKTTLANCIQLANDCRNAFKADTTSTVCDSDQADYSAPACEAAADVFCTDDSRKFMSVAAIKTMTAFCELSGDKVVAFTWKHSATGTNDDYTFFNDTAAYESMRLLELKKYGDYYDEIYLCSDPFIPADYVCDPDTEVPRLWRFNGFEVWIDAKDKTQDRAQMDLLYMIVVCIIFAISSLVFMSDLNTLVIEPVEGLTKAMSLISKSLLDLGATSAEGGEAAYIENSVLKIVSLLQVSFGDAGQRIIQNNMSPGEEGLSMRQAGAKVNGCYGMSDIREFTGTTEALNETIVVFVNEFASICHQSGEDGDAFMDADKPDVYRSLIGQQGGKANKNVGDAFLIVWKEDGESQADLALQAYRVAIQRIRDSETLALLCSKPAFASRFPPQEQPFKKYFPRMGFGLHWGWAIEGAIGSELKTDAIYLGPHVDLADVLEMNTKEYKTPILLSEAFYNQLSPAAQKTCRRVDRVIGGAITEPFDLYAANVGNNEGNHFDPKVKEWVYSKYMWDPDANNGKGEYAPPKATKQVHGQAEVDSALPDDPLALLEDEWNKDFEEAVSQYLNGDWPTATAGLQACLQERPWDGPTQKLLQFMQETPKEDFKGYAKLK